MSRRGYDIMFSLVLPLFIVSAVLWVADIFVPENGWWILLKLFTHDGKDVTLALAVMFVFWTGMMLIGSRFPLRVKNENLAINLMLGGVFAGITGILLMMVFFPYGHPASMPVFYTSMTVFLLSWTASFVVAGMLDRLVWVRIGNEFFRLIRPPRDK